MRLIILLISFVCLSGCMSVKQHESEVRSVEMRWRNRIGLMDVKLRNKEEKYLVLREAYNSLEEDYNLSKKELLDKEDLLKQHVQMIEDMKRKLEEAAFKIDSLSAKIEEDKKKVEDSNEKSGKRKVVFNNGESLLDGFLAEGTGLVAYGEIEGGVICDEEDIGCYAEALTGKKIFREVMIDRLHKQRGFMSDGEIEKLRKSVLKAGKGKSYVACADISYGLSEGGTTLRSLDFRHQYGDNREHWSFRSSEHTVRNKNVWEQLQLGKSICLEFTVKSVQTNYRTWSGIRKSINVYAKPVKAWIVKSNDQTYPLKGKIYKTMFTTKHAKSNVCCRDEMRIIHRFLKR